MTLYNLRNPAVKRLMKEAEELLHPTEEYHAQPLEDNLFEWHFTLKGPPNTDYEGGIYHGRITLPPDYPMKPPSIILLTPNGRFETNKKICLSISGHHPESWQPSWSIRTALLAIIGFMPTHGNGAIGSLDYSPMERKQLALKSQGWQCSECGCIKDVFCKQKSSTCLKEGIQSEKSEDAKNNLSMHLPLNQNGVLKSSGNYISEDNLSGFVTSGTTSLVHRIKSSAKQEVNEKLIQTSKQSKSVFFTVFIWVIAFILVLLCFRRLFM